MTDLLRVPVDDGKYTIVQDAQGRLTVLRYGEAWLGYGSDKADAVVPGSKMLIAMACELEELREKLDFWENGEPTEAMVRAGVRKAMDVKISGDYPWTTYMADLWHVMRGAKR